MIEENNKLIAEFMGGVPCDRCEDCGMLKFGESDYRALEYLRYHSDWNLLMPVVEKIEQVGGKIDIEFSIGTDETWIIQNSQFETYKYGGTKLERTYQAVIEYINWYNQQTP